ncbi:TPA: DUF1090 domain-containing protein [Salmonella enterica subsp. enterica serovar Saintpaul]
MTSIKSHYSRATILAVLLYSVMVSGAVAGDYDGCEYKRRYLKHQLEYAQAYNNTHRMAGLQRALRNINEYCTDGRLPQQKEKKVADKQRKVIERQYELEQTRISGKNEKIANKQAKLAKAREELTEASRELSHRSP